MFTRYQPISRDSAGAITRTGPWRTLDARTSHSGNVTEHLHVSSVEPGTVAGWGGARAVGVVCGVVVEAPNPCAPEGRQIDIPEILCFLA